MSKEKELTIELTTDCQLNCAWCSSDYGERSVLTLDAVYTMLLKSKIQGFTTVRFSGGEPTLYPELLECIMLAKQLDYKIILLTNGIIKYFNIDIDKYEIQWHTEAIENILWLKQLDRNVTINVVNVKESNIDKCLHFCMLNDIPMHIMKLQHTGRASKSKLHEIDISITGDNGCNKGNKLLYNPFGGHVNCAADKFNNICKVKDCVNR